MNRYLTVLVSCLIVLFSSCATESSETPQEVDKPSDYFQVYGLPALPVVF